MAFSARGIPFVLASAISGCRTEVHLWTFSIRRICARPVPFSSPPRCHHHRGRASYRPVRSGTGSTGAVRNRAEFGGLVLLGVSCAACFFVSGLHIRGLGACGESQFANLLPEIGGGLHKSGRDAGIGSCFCHFEQRSCCLSCMEVVRHLYSRLTLCFA